MALGHRIGRFEQSVRGDVIFGNNQQYLKSGKLQKTERRAKRFLVEGGEGGEGGAHQRRVAVLVCCVVNTCAFPPPPRPPASDCRRTDS